MASRGGALRLSINADSRGFQKGLGTAQHSLDRFAKGAGKLSRLGGGGLAGVVGGLTSIGGAAALVKESTNATMDLYKATKRLSTVTGLDMQSSNAWVNLAKSRGVSAGQLTRSYTALAKQIGLAQSGSKKAVQAFTQLGVSQETLRTGNTAEIMSRVSDGFSRYANGLGKSRVASQLFGRAYSPMLALLNKGSGNLKALLRDELQHGARLTLSARQYERARQAQLRFNQSMEKLKVTIGNAVLPYVTRLTNTLSDWLQKGANRQKIEQVVHSFASMAHQVASVLKYLTPVVRRTTQFAAKHPALMKMVAALIAVKVAAKSISFLMPLRGVSMLSKGMGALAARAGVQGRIAGAGFAGAFIAALIPAFESVKDLLSGNVKSGIGRALAMGGGAALGSLFGPVGALAGAGLGGLGYDALFGGNNQPSSNGSRSFFIKKNGKWVPFFGGPMRKLPKGVRSLTPQQVAALNTPSESARMPSLPSLTMPLADPSPTKSGSKSKAKPKAKAKVTPQEALHRAYKLRNWAHPYKVRLARIGSRDNSLAANRRRKSILDQGIAKWKSVRPELKRLAADAHRGGDERILGLIWDLIHDGDALVAKWKTELGAVKDMIAVKGSQDVIDNANRRLQIAQDTIRAEESFLKTAFGFGDIGTGGPNAYTAAGGVMGNVTQAGGNVNITINSLHPGDAKTKAAIGRAVVAAVGNQGSRKKPRANVGGRR
jgi:hypothetical protein